MFIFIWGQGDSLVRKITVMQAWVCEFGSNTHTHIHNNQVWWWCISVTPVLRRQRHVGPWSSLLPSWADMMSSRFNVSKIRWRTIVEDTWHQETCIHTHSNKTHASAPTSTSVHLSYPCTHTQKYTHIHTTLTDTPPPQVAINSTWHSIIYIIFCIYSSQRGTRFI